MAIGFMTIQARTADDAVPIADVYIRISDAAKNIIYEMITDGNGETHTVPLETLDKSFSLNQYYTGLPYISYSVFAQKEGFNSVSVSEIPILDGETAILPIALVPMKERQSSPTQTDIYVGKPAVAMQEARSQEGSVVPPYYAERVLRQVVIPNPITVHLGAPSAYATNVQVPFTDYIKNVASSEIYSTWPDAALRANIYAIITFALNRIYTEW